MCQSRIFTNESRYTLNARDVRVFIVLISAINILLYTRILLANFRLFAYQVLFFVEQTIALTAQVDIAILA